MNIISKLTKLFAIMALSLTALATHASTAGPKVDRIDPPFWWVGMQNDTLQLMIYGPEIARTDVALKAYPGVAIDKEVRLEGPDYLLLYLTVSPQAEPGTLKLTFSNGHKATTVDYTLKAREVDPATFGGFDSSDVLYLIMPDRFARGKNSPKSGEREASLRFPTTDDRSRLHGRHGGDIAGMREHLDYVDSLGVTAIWVNPVQKNDQPGGSYHGYAITDYYAIDPRFGTNDEWTEFISDAHSRGLKVVMDMIFNHTGNHHPWFENLPSKDWYNFPDEYVQTNYRLTTVFDPYVSDYDFRRTVDGAFVRSMPDLNQRNPHLMRYLIQNSIWWIENSKIDGIRMDTHPYADLNGMAQWIRDVRREYPRFNIVGECWYTDPGGSAFWQKGSYTNHKADPELPTVMDFTLMTKARDAFNSPTQGASGGLNTIYDHLALDYLFPDPSHILTFFDNHDTDRFLLDDPDDLGSWKQAQTFLLTTRGIPQIYYGTEILMAGNREKGDGNVRRDMPGGFDGDDTDVFSPSGRSEKQQEAWEFMSKLLNWRRGNETIARGSLKHFMPESGIYVYERRLGDNQVVVILNGNDTDITASMRPTLEIMPYGTQYTDMLTGEPVTIEESMTFTPRQILILEK